MSELISLPAHWRTDIVDTMQQAAHFQDAIGRIAFLIEGWTKVVDPGPIRQGGHIQRHLYVGPSEEDEIAVTVGAVPEAASWARFLKDAGNAYWAAGHRPGEPT